MVARFGVVWRCGCVFIMLSCFCLVWYCSLCLYLGFTLWFGFVGFDLLVDLGLLIVVDKWC